jgi:sterol 14-demethylase
MDSTYKDGHTLPDNHIAGMMIAVLFGGQHTSSTTSAWTILELAARPDLLKALRQEQIDKLGSLKTDLTFENIKDLPLLEAVIRETLRLPDDAACDGGQGGVRKGWTGSAQG